MTHVFTDGERLVVAESLAHVARLLQETVVVEEDWPLLEIANRLGPRLARALWRIIKQIAPTQADALIAPGAEWRVLGLTETIFLDGEPEQVQMLAKEQAAGLVAVWVAGVGWTRQ